MHMIDKIRRLFSKRYVCVELSEEQLEEMCHYDLHSWPKPPTEFAAGSHVWFLGKGKIPCEGIITKLRKVDSGRPYYVIRYGEDASNGRAVHIGDPVFHNREDLLMWHIGENWRQLGRLWKNVQTAEQNADALLQYANRRAPEYRAAIRFLESQLVLRSPDELDWEHTMQGDEQ